MKAHFALVIAALLAASVPARSEDLVSGLSQDVIQITSNYTGTDIVVFGAIENRSVLAPNPADIVVLVRGPDVDMTVRKKERVAGIWLNNHGVVMEGVPAFYFLASTRPLNEIASKATLARYGIALENLEPRADSARTAAIAEPYVRALVRHKTLEGLYNENIAGVEFLSPALFRTRVPVPASVVRGQYNAQVFLFRDGAVVSAQSTPLFVDQTGLERRLFNFAHLQPLSYGIFTVLMATLLGWASSFFFRRNA